MQKSSRAYARLEGAVHIASENLKTQIQNLSNFVRQIMPNTTHQQLIDTLDNKTQTIDSTLKNLLDYTNIQTQNIRLEQTNMQELVDEVLSNFDDIGNKANITTQCIPTSIEIDKNKIAQLLRQLIHNALKFSTPDIPPDIHIKIEEKTDEWVCTVSDNGIGIPENDRYHIFLPFKQLDTKNEGTGMGLAICKTIIEQHQGKIYIASTPEDGQVTTVSFSIPKVVQ